MSTKTSKSNAPRRPAPAAESAPEAVQAPSGSEATAAAAQEPQALISRPALDRGQIDLIRRTICNGATDEEFQLFVMQCQRTGLDPFSRQIHAVRRQGKMVIQVGIDGYRLIADRTGRYAGNDDPAFDDEKEPNRATVTVWKVVAGVRCPFTASARWAQYYPGDGPPGFMWRKMPHLMLGKVAEALALRKAFPAELSGLYTRDELPDDQDHQQPAPVIPAEAPAPPPAALVDPAAELKAKDAALAHEGLCKPGALLAHVREQVKQGGRPWGESYQAARDAAAAFEHGLLLAELDALLDAKGEDAGRVLAKLKAKPGTSFTMLDVAQLRQAIGWLRPLEDARERGRAEVGVNEDFARTKEGCHAHFVAQGG